MTSLVRLRYRPPAIQPELINGKENVSLSAPKRIKPVEEDLFGEIKVVKQEDPIFLATHTQNRRTELIIMSNEEEYRKKHYPTIYERTRAQLDWAETQLEDEKMATKKEAIKRTMDRAIQLAKSQSSTFDVNNELDDALAKLQSEDDKHNQNDDDEGVIDFANIHNPELKEKFIKQYLEIKEKKIMISRNTQQFHTEFSLSARRRVAMKFYFGMKNISFAYRNSKDITFVLPWLLIGRKEIAHNMQQLLSLEITHILNMTNDVKNKFNKHFMYERVPVKDSIDTDMTPYFNTMIQFIKRADDCKGRILVHCHAGASRAPTAVLAYLIVQKKIPLIDAYNYLQFIRPFTQPNKKFLFQLAMLEVQIEGGCSVYFHKEWRFYEFNTFRAERVPERESIGMYQTIMRLLAPPNTNQDLV